MAFDRSGGWPGGVLCSAHMPSQPDASVHSSLPPTASGRRSAHRCRRRALALAVSCAKPRSRCRRRLAGSPTVLAFVLAQAPPRPERFPLAMRQARRNMPPAGPLSRPEACLSLQPHGKTAEIQALDGGEGIGLVLVRFRREGIPGRDQQKQGDGASPDPLPAVDQNSFGKFCKKVIAVPMSPPLAR